ncbi:hypothetical protein PHMEG_00016490 [Phytophthora megakarya]|uniref:Uncharacterized protein n=1 Tax=Phytophthora megakarya TaxID=4795 RepID=A0A225W0T2_9STRA|nr:hypothetical protein PHMEG_00016490 [Phytophthora megakarya]
MTEVVKRLTACTDAADLLSELRVVLSDLAGSQDIQAVVQSVAAFLTTTEERWTLATQTLISDLSRYTSECVVQLELLDALLTWAAQETVEKNHGILEILLQLFQVAITRLVHSGDSQRWIKWGEQVLAVVHQNSALMENQNLLETGEAAEEGSERPRSYVVEIAMLLMQLRKTVERDDDVTPELKTVTFIWKNLAKLATVFGQILVNAAISPAFDSSDESAKGTNVGEQAVEKFSVDELLTDAMVSVERSVGRLLCILDKNTTEEPNLGELKFLKLYWRAFQRLITAFADTLECELENCVLVVVNVTASLLYTMRHNLVPVTSKPGQELRVMLDQALHITEKFAGSGDNGVNFQRKQRFCTLLSYPSVDMIRAVGQRQPSEISNVDIENSIQWGQLLLLTACAGLSGDSSTNSADVDVPYDDANRAVEVSQLFSLYRECGLNDSISRSVEVTELFTDLMIEFLLNFDTIVELQLTLLKHTLYPDWMQRTLCWDIWRELLCFSWNESLAVQTLQMLIDATQWDGVSSDNPFILANGVEYEVLQLIAFLYTDLPVSLKDVCMDQVTAVIDMISSEGPGHQFNLRVASQMYLLEKLVGVHLLKEYDGPMKDEWISKYLPMCFECCGTVIELLSAERKNATAKRGSLLGMVRVLDMCFLVLRAVFDDNEPKQDDTAELSSILVRMATEALSQLAIHDKLNGGSQLTRAGQRHGKNGAHRNVKLENAASRCIGRAIETSLYLLSKLSPVLKTNKNNQCVRVMSDLLVIINTQHISHIGGMDGTLIVTARFAKEVLFDIQVAGDDMVVVWKLLLALFQKLFAATRSSNCQTPRLSLLLSTGLDALYELLAHSNIAEFPGSVLNMLLFEDIKEDFKQCVSMRKLVPGDIAKALETAQSSTLQLLKRNQNAHYRVFRERFPDEPAEPNQGNRNGSNKRSAGPSEMLPQKRHKLTHFVSLCREIESSLSSITDDETAATLSSGTELEDATSVLHKLLTKTITLCL